MQKEDTLERFTSVMYLSGDAENVRHENLAPGHAAQFSL